VRAYRRAIDRAIEKAFAMPDELRRRKGEVPEQRKERAVLRSAWHRENKWRPNQLRHAGATDVRARDGIEAAQQVLGHANVRTTEIYAEPDLKLAEQAARKCERLVKRTG
jgi:site-specific recombinase XerC